MVMQYGPGSASANNVLNISAPTVVKASQGVLYSVSVVVAGTAAGGVYDANTTAGNTQANQIGVLPQGSVTQQPLVFNWLCYNGILIVPPAGGVVSVSFV